MKYKNDEVMKNSQLYKGSLNTIVMKLLEENGRMYGYEITQKVKAITPYYQAAVVAKELNLALNAGHDLDHNNLRYFHQQIPWLKEVSIGHALICDALLWGLENTIQLYKRELQA